MFDPDFNPYDLLVTLTQRITELEQAHNNLAHAYNQTAKDYGILKAKFKNLEQSHLALANHVFKAELEQLGIKNT
jgi:isoprenylcysteine carboxyl methyltransferase (ICMT) family protein YpbQ